MLVRCHLSKLAIHYVLSNGKRMFRIGGDFKLLLVCTADTMQPAQALDAIQPSLHAVCKQLASNLLGAAALGQWLAYGVA